LILYPKDPSSKSNTLQRITAWKLQYYDPIFDILNTAGEDVKYGQLFQIKSLATPAELTPEAQKKYVTNKQPTNITEWIQAVTMARQEGRNLIRDSEAWRTLPINPQMTRARGISTSVIMRTITLPARN
jgi:hypothetical protein